MTIDGNGAGVTDTTTPTTRVSRRVAHVVTEALSPAVLVAGISIAVAWHSRSLVWGVVTAVFASAIPLSYILRGVRRGHYDDHHVRTRERRPAVLLFAAASVVAGLVLMVVLHAPRDLVALVVAMLAGLALTLAVTHWWKVSFHTAVSAGTATTLALVFGPWLLLSWAAVAVVAWSRVRLGDHSVAQTVVGAALGALAAGVVFPLVR
ncbi:MAG TPA: phosphoesterase PA-phosphatase [Rugosimonospora sp.]|nr:phosphoesterase PA-phosphatase [Rugosimonospora sp.]